MVSETRQSFIEEIHHMIRVSRKLVKEGELSQAELITINKHLGALKSTLRDDVIIAPNSIRTVRTRSETYPSMLKSKV